MSEQERIQLEDAIHNFIIALADKSSTQYAVDFLRDEIDEIRYGADQQDTKILLNNITKEEIINELQEVIDKLGKEKVKNIDTILAFEKLVNLKATIRKEL